MAIRKTIKLPTTQRIEKLYQQGKIDELRALNERLAKTANQRMVQLYKSNIETSALKEAKYYLEQVSEVASGGVFSRSKKIDAEDLVEQLKKELIFLRSEGSTVSATKEKRREKVFETLTLGKMGEDGTRETPILNIPKDIQVPKRWQGQEQAYFKKKFLDFLATDAWKDVKKFLYVSGDTSLLQEAGEKISRGATLKDLKEAYTSYLKGEVTIHEMWDTWPSMSQ